MLTNAKLSDISNSRKLSRVSEKCSRVVLSYENSFLLIELNRTATPGCCQYSTMCAFGGLPWHGDRKIPSVRDKDHVVISYLIQMWVFIFNDKWNQRLVERIAPIQLFFFFNFGSYNKFIRSKDLSSKSAEDMACVFGRRSKSDPVTPQELSEVGSRMLNCYPLSIFKAGRRAKAM